MKKIFGTLVIFAGLQAWPCDLCNYFIGITPHDYRHTLGLRYRYSVYHSHETVSHHTMVKALHNEETKTTEGFHTYEAWGRFYPTQKIQMDLVLPFKHNCSESSDNIDKISGLGDILLLTHYEIFSLPVSNESSQQKLLLGGGIKLPSGKFQNDDPHLQAGSGSMDLLIDGSYLLRYGQWGISSNLSYSFNQKNSDGFRFSNRINASLAAFHRMKIASTYFLPNAGILFESAGQDRLDNLKLTETGGQTLLGQIGGDLFFREFAIQTFVSVPVFQSKNQPTNRFRISTGLSYSFEPVRF